MYENNDIFFWHSDGKHAFRGQKAEWECQKGGRYRNSYAEVTQLLLEIRPINNFYCRHKCKLLALSKHHVFRDRFFAGRCHCHFQRTNNLYYEKTVISFSTLTKTSQNARCHNQEKHGMNIHCCKLIISLETPYILSLFQAHLFY